MEWDEIQREIDKYFSKPIERNITLYTGAGGADIFSEAFEKQGGFERVYIGKKVIRILRKLRAPIKKNHRGIYYKLITNG